MKKLGLLVVLASFCLNSAVFAQTGIASVYWEGKRTADGERVCPKCLTAAHRTLPFNTMVRVTNDRNGRSVVVRIDDRGPFVRGRIIDLTPAGAHALGFSGLARVSLEVVRDFTIGPSWDSRRTRSSIRWDSK